MSLQATLVGKVVLHQNRRHVYVTGWGTEVNSVRLGECRAEAVRALMVDPSNCSCSVWKIVVLHALITLELYDLSLRARIRTVPKHTYVVDFVTQTSL